LGWPVEDRYVRFQFETVARLLRNRHQRTAQFLSLWPAGKRYAFVLTHDVETERGQAFVRELAALEVGLGFRSSFNFVAEGYRVDLQLIAELRERGFEVGVHGLKHDGKLFSSEQEFLRRARRINKYLREWGAVGFRAPLTHRHPEWMQALDIEYDSSFCDTDPFETVSGGTMSIWPFVMGAFIELPYTLPQDHIVLSTLRERAPTTWLQKLEFIAQHLGMALLGAHPDYLRVPEHLKVYEAFLLEVRRRGNSWNALPRDVARWWRARQECRPACRRGHWEIHGLPGATVADLALRDDPDGSTSDGPPALVIEGLTAEGRAPSATVSER